MIFVVYERTISHLLKLLVVIDGYRI